MRKREKWRDRETERTYRNCRDIKRPSVVL